MSNKTNNTNAVKPKDGRESRTGSLLSLVPPKSANVDENTTRAQEITMNIKVTSGKNIRGSKGEHVNSMIRVQWSDFDFKDSSIVNDSAFPDYNLSDEHSFPLDDAFIDLFANSSVTVSLYESLPKDKSLLLGTAELSLFNAFLKGNNEAVVCKQSIPFIYTNPKLLGDVQPEIDVEITISKPIIPLSDQALGSFVTLRFEDLFPIPEEWTLKEPNEKDLNSSKTDYHSTERFVCIQH
jgi:hypothetical protein